MRSAGGANRVNLGVTQGPISGLGPNADSPALHLKSGYSGFGATVVMTTNCQRNHDF